MTFALAQSFRSRVTVLTCIHNVPMFGVFETRSEKQRRAELILDAQKSLETITKLAQAHNVHLETKIELTDSISESVVSYIKSHNIDLLIVDSNPPKEIKDEDYKETINRVYKSINCPILTLK